MKGFIMIDCMIGREREVWEGWNGEYCGVEWMRKARERERKGVHSECLQGYCKA